MSSEPKRPVEQMLEALARARRGDFGDEPKMPNPMRARLHEEIKRSEPQEDRTSHSWLAMFWPRMAMAAAVATILILVPTVWWQRSHPGERSEFATRGRAAEMAKPATAEDALAKGPAADTATAPTVNLADNSQVKIESAATPASRGDGDESKHFADVHLTPALPADATKDLLSAETEAAKSQPQAGAAAPAAPLAEPSAVASARSVASAPQSQAFGGSITRQFLNQSQSQSFQNNLQTNRPANVLNSFQVQQIGSDIRVLDADGSTYSGKMKQLAAAEKRATGKQNQTYDAPPKRSAEAAPPQTYFRASGYNVSLKKTLVFEGNYTTSPPQESAARKEAAVSSERQQPARIVGTARLSGESPVEVDATEVLDAARNKSER